MISRQLARTYVKCGIKTFARCWWSQLQQELRRMLTPLDIRPLMGGSTRNDESFAWFEMFLRPVPLGFCSTSHSRCVRVCACVCVCVRVCVFFFSHEEEMATAHPCQYSDGRQDGRAG